MGVSIVRAGIALENALQDVCKDIRIGKILIQSDVRTGEPQVPRAPQREACVERSHERDAQGSRRPPATMHAMPLQLHYLSLPPTVAHSQILLLDATIATGAAAFMAIRVLLDHGVPQESIIFLALIAARPGSWRSAAGGVRLARKRPLTWATRCNPCAHARSACGGDHLPQGQVCGVRDRPGPERAVPHRAGDRCAPAHQTLLARPAC